MSEIQVRIRLIWVGLLALSKEHQNRDKGGKFAESSHPPARQVQVSLPEPFIEALDAYGREHGTGRGRSIVKLLEGVLTPSSPPDPLPVAQRDLEVGTGQEQ